MEKLKNCSMYRVLFCYLSLMIISCSFPNRKLLSHTEKIKSDCEQLKTMIISELPESKPGYPVSYIKNANLKTILHKLGVSEISITYESMTKTPDTVKSSLPFLNSALDSTITFSWIRRINNQIRYSNIYYFFGKTLPRHQVLKLNRFKDKKINDNIWIQKRVDDIVIVH